MKSTQLLCPGLTHLGARTGARSLGSHSPRLQATGAPEAPRHCCIGCLLACWEGGATSPSLDHTRIPRPPASALRARRALTRLGCGRWERLKSPALAASAAYVHACWEEGGAGSGSGRGLLPRASRSTPPLGAGGRGRADASVEEVRGGQRCRAVFEYGPVCRRGHVGVAKPGPRRAVPTCCLSCVSLHAPAGSGSSGGAASAGGHLHRGLHAPMVFEGRMHPWCRVFTARQGGAPQSLLASEMNQTVIARLTGRLKEASDDRSLAVGAGTNIPAR